MACVETGSSFLPMITYSHYRQKQMVLIHTEDTHNIQTSNSRLAERAAQNDETAAFGTVDDNTNSSDDKKDIRSMRLSEIQKELKSLNVSSKDCFDRESLTQRLLQARRQPPQSSSPQESQPQPEQSTRSESSSTTATATTSTGDETNAAPTAGTSSTTGTTDTQSQQQLKDEVSALSVRELRSELAASGKRWAGMLEKRDLVDAVVKCRQETAIFSVTGRMRPGLVTDLTADELTQELQSTSTLILLDVYATW
jgi:hypothetical protein